MSRPRPRLTDTLDQLGRPVVFHPELARFLGSIAAALLLEQLWYWHDRGLHESYVFKTSAEIERETALSYKEQRSARARLKSLGILRETHARLQHELHFAIAEEKLDEAWSTWIAEHRPNRKRLRGKKLPKRAPAQKAVREMTSGQFANRPKGSSIPESTPYLTARGGGGLYRLDSPEAAP